MEETTKLQSSIPTVMDVDTVKLIKNTKGYNWEIKLCGNVEVNLERLSKINEEMQNEYGKSESALSNLCD